MHKQGIKISKIHFNSLYTQGDSGGPLVCARDGGFKLAGLTSWGSGECHTNYPNIYTRISSFRDWVDYVMENY